MFITTTFVGHLLSSIANKRPCGQSSVPWSNYVYRAPARASMHNAILIHQFCQSVRPSVCPSNASTVFKNAQIVSFVTLFMIWYLTIQLFDSQRHYKIPKGTPQREQLRWDFAHFDRNCCLSRKQQITNENSHVADH